MRGRARSVVVLVGVVALGLPTLGHAQAPTVTRGLLRGSLPSDGTRGLVRAPESAAATSGLLRGSLPAGATSGLLSTGAPPSGGTVGGFRGSLASGARSGLLRGDLPAGTPVGSLPTPAPVGARLGDPGPADVAGGLQSDARIHLIKGDYGNAESQLREAVSIREETSGKDSHEVVQTLENNASVLRQWNRETAAAGMDAQAAEIRERQAAKVSPTAAPLTGSAPRAPVAR